MKDWLREYLVPGGRGFVSVTGGGGKTSFLIWFSKVLREEGLSVLMTTTTKIEAPGRRDWGAGRVFSDDRILSHAPLKGDAVLYAVPLTMEKWQAPPQDVLTCLSERYDVILAEADGSRQRPLKVHTARDPVIHPSTSATVAVLGLWGIGGRIEDVVYGDGRKGLVDEGYLDWYVRSPEGLLKGMTGKGLVILNGAEAYPVPELCLPDGVALCTASLREGRILSHVR